MPVLSYVHQLFNAEHCHAYIHTLRWKDRHLQCPRCQSHHVGPWGAYHYQPGLQRYRCKEKDCKRTFNALTGTLLDGSKRSIMHWILATFLLCLSCSSRRIARELGVHVRTGYRWCWWLRNAAQCRPVLRARAAVGGYRGSGCTAQPGLKRYRCIEQGCKRTFNALTGTLSDGSKRSAMHWILATFLLCLSCSSRRIARELGVHMRTSYRWCWWLRHAALSYEMSRQLAGTVEADDLYRTAGDKGQPKQGGKKALGRRARGRRKKREPGRGHDDKDRPAIIAWVSRQGAVVIHATRDFTVKTVQKAADLAVQAGSRLYTDSAGSYRALTGYFHAYVNHTRKEYARGDVHENRAECLFSLLKPYLRVFRGVSKYNLPGYVEFFQFLRNFRQYNAFEQAELILQAALDPAIARKAKQGECVTCFDHFDLLQTAIN